MHALNKDTVIARNMLALAKRKKGGNDRSKMLKVIMPHLSQDTGKKLAKAIADRNVSLFKATWDSVKKEIADKLRQKSESSADNTSTPQLLNSDVLDDMQAAIIKDMQVEESVSAVGDYHDYSRVLLGHGTNTVKIRELIANGSTELKNTAGDKTYVLNIDNLKVVTKQDKKEAKLQNVTVRVEAGLYDMDGSLVKTYVENDSLAVSCTEIVLKAMAATQRD